MPRRAPPHRRQVPRSPRGRILALAGAGLVGLILWATIRAPVAAPPVAPSGSLPHLAAASAAPATTLASGQPPAAPRRRQSADIIDSLDIIDSADPAPPAPTGPPGAPPLPTAPPVPTAPPPPAPTPAPTVDPYRQWIHEARLQYPYPESEEQMHQLMLCESSGNPAADSPDGLYHGLFQYSAETWAGDWNPYRDQSIYDAQAQIWATACAWNLGMQQQWGCYSSVAP
jgi:hypothetical protein